MMRANTRMAIEAAEYVRSRISIRPKAGLILGSGLNALAEHVQEPVVIPYADIPNLAVSTVSGHAGRLVVGMLADYPSAVLQGRVHYYEGYTPAEITRPVRLLKLLGVETLIITNAAGAVSHHLAVGDLMAIIDHINLPGLAGHHPLRGPNDETLGPRFPEMTVAYDRHLLAIAHQSARQHQIALKEGVYAMVAGPSFETPAEVRYLRTIGADAVGMSTVPEVIVARHAGIRVLAISLITNVAVDSLEPTETSTNHQKV
ncbi:MAG: purine-nucleoside phosphorylase, partial [Anaerolineae bacterium]|nr:purine-nucleoside phosphorylase [Anaerolineae bacterium]